MKYLKIIIILAIIVVLFLFFFKNVNFTEVLKSLKNINPIYPIVFIFGCLLQFFIRGYRWGIILKPYKNKIPILTLYNFTVIGFFLNIIPGGRVGEAARGILLAREVEIKRSYGLASVVLERVIDILIMTLLFLTSLFFIDNKSTFLLKLKDISLYLLIVMLFIFCMFYMLNLKKIFILVERFIYFISKISPKKIRERVALFLLSFVKGLKLNLSIFGFIKLFLSSIVVWLSIIPFFWFLMKGFDIDINIFKTIPYFCVIAVSASVPTPAMAGSLDAGSKLGLTKLFNVSPETAVAYTLLFHFLIVACTIIAGLIAFWKYGLNFKIIRGIKKNNEMS